MRNSCGGQTDGQGHISRIITLRFLALRNGLKVLHTTVTTKMFENVLMNN